MRKSIMFMLTLVIGLSMIMAACSSGSDSSSSGSNDSGNKNEGSNEGGSDKVTLNVTTTFGGNDPGHKAYEDLLSQFKEKHPNVTIKRNDFTANNKSKAKFETKWTGGTIPDVLFYFNDSQAKYIYDSEKMVPMKKIMDNNPEWADSLNEAALDGVKTLAPNGKLLAIPLNGYYEGLIVNKKMFTDNGLELPKDWDKFKKAIQTFQDKDMIPVSASMNEANYVIEHSILGAGGAKCHGKGLADGVPDCYVDGLNLIKKMYDMGAFPKDTLTLADDQAAQQYYQKGQAAMLFDGSWAIGGLPEKVAKNSTVMPIPTPPESGGYDGNQVISGFSSGWYVSKDAYNSDKKKAAVDFLKFMTSKNADTKFANAFGAVPSVKGVEVDADSPAAKDGLDMAQNASALEPASDGFIPKKVYNHMRDNIPSLVKGDISAKELLEEAKDKAIK